MRYNRLNRGGEHVKKEALYAIFSKMPTLETQRLILRPMRVTDSADMYAYARNPEVSRFLTWSPHPDISHTRRYLEYLGGRYRIGAFYEWAIVHRETGRMIGSCGFTTIDTVNHCADIGYVMNPDFHGQGLMTEAARCVRDFGFDVIHLNRIEGRFMIENTASRRVMERIGMRYEGMRRSAMLVKGAYRDIGMCAMLHSDPRM